uniref:Uncharacterized protein n=1 Tax=Leptobrachium leishanense TaxID=445787 RepID=A0A8C5WGP4_9ANUR
MIEPNKRKGLELVPVPAKKSRNEVPVASVTGPPRTSSLQAPIMLLSGHEGEVYCSKFHPNGLTLWSSYGTSLQYRWNEAAKGTHTSFVNSCYPARRGPQFICTGSDDGTVKLWDFRKKASVCGDGVTLNAQVDVMYRILVVLIY